MSTLPGQASKAEKTKSKFQSLDINSLYRVSRGENLEKQQQKSSSVYIKHGMQSLGRVPNARRAPANLPSLKAEHSGSDAAVPLVPPGAQGWGKQDASNAAQPPPPSQPPAANVPSQNAAAAAVAAVSASQPAANPQISPHQAAIALPVTNPVPHPHKQLTPSAQPAPVDKLWSSVMSGQDVPHPPLYQSPQFQHEFPSLSAGDGGPTRTGSDAPQYPSGLSLRPQTEGSWTQGGTRPSGPPGGDPAAGGPGSGPQGAPPPPSAQGGPPQGQQQQPFPPQMRGVMPSFMYKGSGFQQQQQQQGASAHNATANGHRGHRGGGGGHPRPGGLDREAEDALPRPIIKEEELTRMDEIGKDMGWAESDEIDYNQKLAFSDDEGDRGGGAKRSESKRRQPTRDHHPQQQQQQHKEEAAVAAPAPRQQRGGPGRSRPAADEEDAWTQQRRSQTDKEVELAVQRAKQRKEEEEKRFQEERKQAAAKKLMELEEKIQRRDKEAPSSEPAAAAAAVVVEDKSSSFRQLTQIEGKNFPPSRKPAKQQQQEPGAPFSKNFQNDLPPRFLKHQRGGGGGSNPQQQQQFESRWSQNASEEQPSANDNNREEDSRRLPPPPPKEKSTEWGRPPRDFLAAWSEPAEERKQREAGAGRAVPGPITRERIEADDVRGGDKRNLTQLRRGQPAAVEVKRQEEAAAVVEKKKEPPSQWADSIPPALLEEQQVEPAKKPQQQQQQQPKKGWGGGGQPWQRGGRRKEHTDSDGSADDHRVKADGQQQQPPPSAARQKSPRPTRRNGDKFGGGGGGGGKPSVEKRESYVPRGEPSRHGRGGGGGNFRSGGRMASMGKKIDGYGPPPAKSPFGGGHHDDKDNKPKQQQQQEEAAAAATENATSAEDKIKQNQQALAAGIIGKRSEQPAKPKPEARKNGGKPRGEKPKQTAEEKDKDKTADAVVVVGDSEGFQEVRSKKAAVKERHKSSEDKSKSSSKTQQQLTPQQIQNIPPLMATPVNPPPVMLPPKGGGGGFDRGRQTSKLPPRFAKQKLQKQAAMQQQQQLGEQLSKTTAPPPSAPACAWDKPLGLAAAASAVEASEPPPPPEKQEQPLLDGSSAPVNTIIFENTNFKAAPPPTRPKPDPAEVAGGFGKPPDEGAAAAADAMPMPLFKGSDAADMKIDFFSADLQFGGDDKGAKNFVAKSIHAITSGNNTVDSLDIKIASVKKVWDTSEQEGEDSQMAFGGAPLDSNVFSQGKDASEETHEGYSPASNQSSAQTNVCKVKPTQQVSGGGQSSAMGAAGHHHQPHGGAAGLMGNPLSPPPIAPVLGGGVGMGPPFAGSQHMGYQNFELDRCRFSQTGVSTGGGGGGGGTQYGMSAVPSPPAVPLVYGSSQQLQSAAASLYGAFHQQLEHSAAARSQFSQYAGYHHGLGQAAPPPPGVYLPTPQPPPPPQAAQQQQPPPPELYQNINSFRLSATTPFGQSQQLSNPTTVLISSTSNSLMSASVKPSGQQISAIGTKAGGVGQAYQQQSQQGQQVFMTYDPSMQANYLASNAGVMQRAPVGPAQNNVVPGLQPSSSYYSGSTGGQTGFFQQPGNSAQLSQHQAGYGLQGNVFGSHSQSHTNTALQNYNSHFLTAPMQVAAALSAQQQFRSNLPAAAYMKGVGDQSGRSQQLKSPGSQEVLSSVFNSGPQIPSPKSRQNMKHPPQQSSPTSQHKYNMYQQQGLGGPPNMNMQRYPTPIQRPVNFQQMQQNSVNQKHRNNPNSNKPSNNRYYGNQNHSLSGQNEKCDDAKMDGGGSATGVAKGVSAGADGVKEGLKEEAVALKD